MIAPHQKGLKTTAGSSEALPDKKIAKLSQINARADLAEIACRPSFRRKFSHNQDPQRSCCRVVLRVDEALRPTAISKGDTPAGGLGALGG
jgi:hypothetical protein